MRIAVFLKTALLLVLILAGPAVLCAQGTGNISGTVLSATGNPIEGVKLYLYGSNGFNFGPNTTDATGAYTFSGVSSSPSYFLRTFNSAGFVDQLYRGIDCVGFCVFDPISFASSLGATRIRVANGSTTTVNFSLIEGGRFSGSVTAVGGTPIANAHIAVVIGGVIFEDFATTDSNGVYLAWGLPTGSYVAYTSNNGDTGYLNQMYNGKTCPTSGCNTSLATSIPVTLGATTSNIDFSLTKGGTISGRVTDGGGTPLAGIEVDVQGSGSLTTYKGITDESGQYTVIGLPAASYFARTNTNAGYLNQYYNGISCGVTCSSSGAAQIPVGSGADVANINFSLGLAGRITGTVRNRSGVPVPHQFIDLYSSSGNSLFSTSTDDNGVYLFSGVPAGVYFLKSNIGLGYVEQLYNGIMCAGGCAITSGAAVTVSPGATASGIDFSIGKPGIISGVVTSTGGVPLAGVQLTLFNSQLTGFSSQQTNAGGVYTFNGVAPGSYILSTSNNLGYSDQLYHGINCPLGCPLNSATLILVDLDSTTPLNFALEPAGRISGTVTGNGGLPVSSLSIIVYSAAGAGFTSATTDSTGTYSIGGLATGTYFARTSDAFNKGYFDWAFNGIPCNPCNSTTTGTPINVTAPETTSNINFALAPSLSSITPSSGSFGNSVDVTLGGSGFGGEMTINPGSGITVTNLTVVNANTATATFVIAASAAEGSRAITATYRGGTSAPAAFTVNNPHRLTISKAGSGNGAVNSSPAAISCGVTCTFIFNPDEIVTLTAVPVAGSIFSGWSGDADCVDGNLTMSDARDCIAYFALAPVAVDDSFSVDKGGTLNIATPGVLGNDTDADGNPMTAVQMTSPIHGSVTLNADGSFSYVHDGSDVISDSFTYKTNDGLADSNLATVTLNIGGLLVKQFQPTSSGFVTVFNRPIDAAALNLYNTETGGLGPPDVTLVGVAGGAIRGSLVVSGNGETVTFIRTGGVLPPDTYTATLRSAVDGFKSPTVGLLDGNNDGIAADDFSTTFTVANSSAVVVSVPDFLRGPGQDVNLSGTGISVTLSDGAGVSQIDLVLKYDPSLLVISQVTAGAGLSMADQVQSDFSLPDRIHIAVATSLPLSGGAVELVRIVGNVPTAAPYRASQILAIASLSLNDGSIPAISDDGLHVVAYIGDSTGNASYSSLDAQRILRVATGLDSGFAAFPKIDPVVIGDITGNGALSSLDATRLLQEIVGIDRPEIPPLP